MATKKAKLTPGYAEFMLRNMGPIKIAHQAKKSKLALASQMLDAMRKRGRNVNIPKIGRLYYYQYDPKTKETLPYWDQFPVVIPIQMYSDGWLGINFHYLDPFNRAILMDRLTSAYMTGKNDAQRLKLTYQILKNASRASAFFPCLKRYLAGHLRSPILEVERGDWLLGITLPLAKFHGATEAKVHRDSRKNI